MKKLLATILALVMALGVTTISWADEVTLPDGIGFTGENTLYWVSGGATGWKCQEMCSREIPKI